MKIKFSCVVENNSELLGQAFIWLGCLIELAKIPPADIFVHTIGDFKNQFIDKIEKLGCKRVVIDRFSNINPYCNKLNQLNTFVEGDDLDYVFLMDCDTAITSLDDLKLEKDVYAKIVDFPVPPLAILNDIFRKAGFNPESLATKTSSFKLNNDQMTYHNNCNGGLYVLSKKVIAGLDREWKNFAKWSLQNLDLYGKYSKHVDQVSFALAMETLGIEVTHMDIEWNFPVHVDKKMISNVTPKIIHFHSQVNEHLKLKTTSIKNVDSAIATINSAISVFNNKHFDNSLFWNIRYKRFPELGSGIGSRGKILEIKRCLLSNVLYNSADKSVIDVGCGDIEVIKIFRFKTYTGIDLSNTALEIARKKRPDWNFICGDLPNLSADIVLCLDVLIHQPTIEQYQGLVNQMIDRCNDRLIIGAYTEPPSLASEITFYHESIIDTLLRTGEFSEINIAGSYRDVSLVVANKRKSSSQHQRDISADDYNLASKYVARGDLLRYLVDLSRHSIGFFTQHFTRTIEYTWLADKLEDTVKGKRILDVGAGVSPLPIYFSNVGAKVVTIDYHQKKRLLKDRPKWNEWGFLDYGLLDRRVSSYNKNISKFYAFFKFDVIYSISVIEHMPKDTRNDVLTKIRKLLKRRGRLLLTIDMIPGTNSIWNYSEGKEVDVPEQHGDIGSLEEELNRNRLRIVSQQILRDIPKSRTDILFLDIVKC